MKKTEMKVLKEKLLIAIKKVIKDNKVDLTTKMEKVVKKSIKQIAKKTAGKKNIVSANNGRKPE